MPRSADTFCCCRPATISSVVRQPCWQASPPLPSSRIAIGRLAAWRLPLFAVPDSARLWTSLASFLVMLGLIAAGIFGSRDPLSNPLPLTVWTLIWIGLTLLQGCIRQSLGLAQSMVRTGSAGRHGAPEAVAQRLSAGTRILARAVPVRRLCLVRADRSQPRMILIAWRWRSRRTGLPPLWRCWFLATMSGRARASFCRCFSAWFRASLSSTASRRAEARNKPLPARGEALDGAASTTIRGDVPAADAGIRVL